MLFSGAINAFSWALSAFQGAENDFLTGVAALSFCFRAPSWLWSTSEACSHGQQAATGTHVHPDGRMLWEPAQGIRIKGLEGPL